MGVIPKVATDAKKPGASGPWSLQQMLKHGLLVDWRVLNLGYGSLIQSLIYTLMQNGDKRVKGTGVDA